MLIVGNSSHSPDFGTPPKAEVAIHQGFDGQRKFDFKNNIYKLKYI